MIVAEAVAEFLAKHVKHVFCISGGASLWLIHAIAHTKGITYVCPQHEQAAGYMADAYARLTGFGCAIVTSGPGATNLITAIASSYYDSVPVLYITGQVATFRMVGDSGVRQIGFQETPIIDMIKPITKACVQVRHPQSIFMHLENLVKQAKSGRPGPVLLDLPDDLQRADVTTIGELYD